MPEGVAHPIIFVHKIWKYYKLTLILSCGKKCHEMQDFRY